MSNATDKTLPDGRPDPGDEFALTPAPQQRRHKATYATDKRKGGYIVRVEGPECEKFAGRIVPVTMRSGDEHEEQLNRLLWSGINDSDGKPVALYSFVSRPKVELRQTEF